jgi:hypothetical protein
VPDKPASDHDKQDRRGHLVVGDFPRTPEYIPVDFVGDLMKKNCVRLFLCCAICSALGPVSLAQKKHRPRIWALPQVFSNLILDPETGDVGGIEVILIKSYSQDWVAVMMASGVAEDPVLVPVVENGATIEFTLPPQRNSNYGKFRGVISRAGLTLYSDGKRLDFLRRQSR